MPAVGFSLKVNDIMSTMRADAKAGADILVVYDEDSRASAFKRAEELRAEGFTVEISLIGSDIDKNKEYAAKKGIRKILYAGIKEAE